MSQVSSFHGVSINFLPGVHVYSNLPPYLFFHLTNSRRQSGASQVAPVVKSPIANVGDIRDIGLIPGLGRDPGGGHGNPLQYSCLENPTDGGAWRATLHRVAKRHDWKDLACRHAEGNDTVSEWLGLNRCSPTLGRLLLWVFFFFFL